MGIACSSYSKCLLGSNVHAHLFYNAECFTKYRRFPSHYRILYPCMNSLVLALLILLLYLHNGLKDFLSCIKYSVLLLNEKMQYGSYNHMRHKALRDILIILSAVFKQFTPNFYRDKCHFLAISRFVMIMSSL